MTRRLFTAISAVSVVLLLAMVVLLIVPPWKSAVLRCGRYEVHVRMRPGGGPLQGGGSISFWWPYMKEGDGDEPQPSGPPHTSVGDLTMEHHRLLGLPYTTGGWATTVWLTPHRYKASGMYFSLVYFHYRTCRGPLRGAPRRLGRAVWQAATPGASRPRSGQVRCLRVRFAGKQGAMSGMRDGDCN